MNRNHENKTTTLKFLTAAGISLGAALVGLLINILINNYWIGFKDFQNCIAWITLADINLMATLDGVLGGLGYQSGMINNFAVNLANVVAIGIFVLLLVSFVNLFRHRERYQSSETMLGIFCLMSIVVMVLVTTLFVFDNYANIADSRYFLPVLVFVIPWLALYLQKGVSDWRMVWQKFTVRVRSIGQGAVWCVVLLVCLVNCGCYCHSNNNQTLRTIAEDLSAAGYDQGYASLWQANILTEFTNGAIEVWSWGDPQDLGFGDNDDPGLGWERFGTYNNLDQVQPWLQRRDHFYRQPTGKVFWLFTTEENAKLVIPQKLATLGVPIFYADQNYVVYTHDNVDELRTILDATATTK